jgi:hypothetical protein
MPIRPASSYYPKFRVKGSTCKPAIPVILYRHFVPRPQTLAYHHCRQTPVFLLGSPSKHARNARSGENLVSIFIRARSTSSFKSSILPALNIFSIASFKVNISGKHHNRGWIFYSPVTIGFSISRIMGSISSKDMSIPSSGYSTRSGSSMRGIPLVRPTTGLSHGNRTRLGPYRFVKILRTLVSLIFVFEVRLIAVTVVLFSYYHGTITQEEDLLVTVDNARSGGRMKMKGREVAIDIEV